MPDVRLLAALLCSLCLAPAVAAQDKPDKPAADKPAATAEKDKAKPLDEKDLVHEFDAAFRAKDPAARAQAVTTLGDGSRALPDAGGSRYMAKALAKALADEDLEVQAAAVGQLAWGRDVDTVVGALGDQVESVRKEIDKRITRPDPESKEYCNRGTRLFADTCSALANYRDDRSVKALSDVIARLRPNTDGADVSTRLVGRIAEALLSLGTQDAVEACVRQTQTYSDTDGFQEPAAKELHRVLSQYATKIGKAPPDFTQTYYVAWHEWLEKNKDGIPKKLGKIKEPPTTPPAQAMYRGPQDEGAAAPR